MDVSFSLRKRRRPREPDLAVLLADAGALQATSPTAQAQARVAERRLARSATDQRIDLFAGCSGGPDGVPHRFAAIAIDKDEVSIRTGPPV